jgi:hypothetical protein
LISLSTFNSQLSTGFPHRFPLEQTAAAIRLASKPTEDSLKVLVCVDGD